MRLLKYWLVHDLQTMDDEYKNIILTETPVLQIQIPCEFRAWDLNKLIEQIKTWPTLRVWDTKTCIIGDEFISYATLCKQPGFTGIGNFENGYLIECWDNYGEYGRLYFKLIGYGLIAYKLGETLNFKTIHKLLKENNICSY